MTKTIFDKREWTFTCATKEEAQAFIEGVSFVNDSSLKVTAIEPIANGWKVVLEETE